MKLYRKTVWGLFALLFLTSVASAQKVWKIMPVGNSITAGVGSGNSYGFRDDLANKLTGAGISYEFVGPDGTPYNGHFLSGAKVEDFLPGGPKDITVSLTTYQPNILLLHLGTNNLTHTVAPYSNNRGITYESNGSGYLATLLRYLAQYSNGTKGSFLERVLVCKIIPRFDDSVISANVDLYNAEIERMFFENPPFAKMTIVDMNSIMSKSDYSDTRHPNDSGYLKMASEYANVLNGVVRTDATAPGAVGNLVIQPLDAQTAGLSWTASGDDASSGRANLYELRYATYQLTDKNFTQGKLVSLKRPAVSGSKESKSVDHLVSGLTYYFGIRVYDEWNNRSGAKYFPPVAIEGTAGYRYCDDFSDATLPDWSVNPYFEVNIVEQDLGLKSGTPALWEYLAAFSAARYNSTAKSVKTTMTWSRLADKNGMFASGIAMMLDSPSYTANGYMVRLRNGVIYLNEIRAGVLQSSEIQRYTSTAANITPTPGDSLVVRYFPGGLYGHTFDVYLNKTYVGQLYDKNKVQGNADHLYSGVMLYGGNMMNSVTNFCLEIPPLAADSMQTFVGNQQRGQITQRLAEPLTVKVTDVNGIAVSDVPIDFDVTSGQALLSTDSLSTTFNGNLWMEAEKGELSGPYISSNAIEASKSEFIYVPQDINREKGKAAYSFYNIKAGTFRLWLRVMAQDGSHNSCFFSVNGSDTLQFDFSGNFGAYAWYPYNSRSFSLPQGFINFAIKNRESNTRIDKILLTNNSSYIPSGLGETTQRFSNLTDEGGLAYTFLTFTTAAGAVQVKATAANIPNGSPQTFNIYADALDPQTMIYASERVLSDTVGQSMSAPFSVRMQDKYSNNCVGIAVDFTVTDGDGMFGGQNTIRVTSDNNGVASAYLTLGYKSTGSKIKAQLADFPGIPSLTFEAIPDKEGVPIEIVAIKGKGQKGTVHAPLADSLIVQVLDRNSRPVYKYPVPFKITKGNGSFNGLGKSFTDSTNIYGKAHARFVLGDTAGTANNQVTIDVALNGAPIIFTADALPDIPAAFTIQAGNSQVWYAGETFPTPLTVKLADRYGNGRKGFGVKFTLLPETGNGNFSGQDTITVATDSLGLAGVYYNAGNIEGINQVRAEVASSLNIPAVLFSSLTVQPPKPNRILEVSGNYQDGVVNTTLNQPFKVKVIDPFGQTKANVKLLARVTAGGGKVNDLDSVLIVTDENGLAQVTLRTGTQSGYNNQIVRIRSVDYNLQPVEFYATAVAGKAHQMAAVSDLYFSEKAEALAPLQIIIKDEFGNPKAGQAVAFSITEGNGSFDQNQTQIQSTTGQSGVAVANYHMGTSTSISNVIIAESVNSDGVPLLASPLTFVGTVIAGAPGQMVAVLDGDYSGPVLSLLSKPFVAQVRDVYGNPVQHGVIVNFKVTAGGGAFGTDQEIDMATDENGQAQAYLRLGPVAGMNNNRVTATVRDYAQISQVNFSASALADAPDQIVLSSDSVFSGKVKAEFNPAVQVTDLRGNPINNFPVLFKVMAGGGKLKGVTSGQWQDTVRVLTDLDGRAAARWQFGVKPDSNLVYAFGLYEGNQLTNSPIIFRGWATPEEAQYLVRVSALTDTGVVNNPVTRPLQVRVTDRNGNLVPNHPVLFEVIYPSVNEGQGKLYTQTDMSDTSGQKTLSTDSKGLVQVYFLLSKRPGPNYIKATSRFSNSTQALFGSPINFHIEGMSSPAKKLLLLTASTLTGSVQSTHRVSAKAVDVLGGPVMGHPVQFKTLDENSTLNGSTNRWVAVNTGNDGVASVDWTLGKQSGANKNSLEISSPPLENSPFTIKANVTAGPASARHSQVVTIADSVAANNLAQAQVQVTVMDSLKNAISGASVTWLTNDQGLQFNQTNSTTGSDGRAVVFVRSTISGKKSISCRINSQIPFTLCCAPVTFMPGAVAKLLVYHGDGMIGNVGTALHDSLAVRVLDANNNPIPNSTVLFTVQSGGGFFLESMLITQTDVTDANGVSRVFLVLGKQINLDNVVLASIGNLQTIITCKTRSASAAYIYKHQEKSLQGAVGELLADPLLVRVEDSSANPVWNATVTFTPSDSDGVITSTNPVKTDYLGLAQVRYQLGHKAGDRFVTARCTGAQNSATFMVRAVGKNPAQMILLSGNNQQAKAGQQLAQPFKVQVRDEYGNGVANSPIIFKLVEGKGATIVGPDTVVTDLQGLGQCQVLLGAKTGDYAFLATCPSLAGQALLFQCHALPDVAYKLDRPAGTLSHDNQQMTIGRELLLPIVAAVQDKYNNPVKNELVQFTVVENDGYFINPKAMSDDSGRVYGRWVLGKKAGVNKAMAYRLGLYNSPIAFTATGVLNNFPEFYDLPAYQQTLEYNQLLSFTVKARDADDDPLHYSLKIKPNPTNAVFDSSGSRLFYWTPTVRQKGTWKFHLSVQDNKGGFDIDSLLVKVTGDSAPVITSLYPACGVPLSLTKPDSTVFTCAAVDYDGDPLTFRWFVNGIAFEGARFVFRSTQYPKGSLRIWAEVSDGIKTTKSCEWTMLVTQVQLNLFQAQSEPFSGVHLNWQTAAENNNLGFDVLRSINEHSGYQRLSDKLIACRSDGAYNFVDSSAVAGITYYYKLLDLDLNGIRTEHGPVCVSMAVPNAFAVMQNYPNPFNPETRIRFQLPAAARTRIAIFNTLGQLVRQLTDTTLPAGYHEFKWDGKDEQGLRTSSGVYYYRVEAGVHRSIKKMVMLK